MAFGPERTEGPDHIFDGDRAAIGKAGLGPQGEFDPGSVGGCLNRFGQKAVKREGFVLRPAHQALMGKEPKLPGNGALTDIGVERVKAADIAERDPAALWRIRIDIGQRHKIRWQRGFAIHSYAMLGLGTQILGGKNRENQGGYA